MSEYSDVSIPTRLWKAIRDKTADEVIADMKRAALFNELEAAIRKYADNYVWGLSDEAKDILAVLAKRKEVGP